jgi:hypothetical protein
MVYGPGWKETFCFRQPAYGAGIGQLDEAKPGAQNEQPETDQR